MNDNKLDIHTDVVTGARKLNVAKISNHTTWVLIGAVIIAAIASMGELGLSLDPSAIFRTSLLCVVLFIVASLIYRMRYTNGAGRAKESEAFKKALEEYNEIKEKIHESGVIKQLSALCVRYRKMELQSYRTAILSDACIDYKTYEKEYKEKSDEDLLALNLSPNAIKCIRKADRARGLRLSPNDLLSDKKTSFIRFSALSPSPASRQNFDVTLNTVSRLITTGFAGSVSVVVMFSLSWQAVCQWAIRMIPIVWAAFKGDHDGEKNVMHTAIPYMSRQTQILTLMLEWATSPDEEAEQ